MSSINELIAVAVDKDLPKKPTVDIAINRGRLRLVAALVALLLFIVVYEYEHISSALAAPSEPIEKTQDVEQLYDHAIAIMTARFEQGRLLTSPFNDPELDNWMGVTYLGEGEYLLFYMGSSGDHPIPARKVRFDW